MERISLVQNAGKLLRRVRMLREVAERSCNAHEAQAAALLAQKLVAEHGLSETGVEVEDDNPVIESLVVPDRKRMPRWQDELLAVLAAEFRCVAVSYRRRGCGRRLTLIGRSRDCAIVVELWLQAVSAASRLSARYAREARAFAEKGVSARTSWCHGFVAGLAARLAEQRGAHQEWGLVLVPDDAVREEIEKRGLTPERVRRSRFDVLAWRAGRTAGHAHDASRHERIDEAAQYAALPGR
jgi:hypothetical protein